MSRVHWRSLFPEWRRLLLAVAACAALMSLVAFVPPVPDDERPYVEAFTWLLPGFLWACLVGARPVSLAWQMLGLRLPGIARVLVLSHGASMLALFCSVVLLASVDDFGRISGTLLLGWGLGLLVLALPNHWSAPFVPPAIWIVGQYGHVWWPQTAFEFWLSALLVLSLVAILWWRQCSSERSWQPIGFLLDMPMRGQLEQVNRRAPFGRSQGVALGTSPFQRLEGACAPALKGRSPEASWRDRLTSAFFLAVAVLMVVWFVPSSVHKTLIWIGVIPVGVVLIARPTRYLLAEQARISQSLIAELRLLPGLPNDAQWLRALCVQILRGAMLWVLMAGVLFSLLGWRYSFHDFWLQWIWIYLLSIPALSLARVLQVGLLGEWRGRWEIVECVLSTGAVASATSMFFGAVPVGLMLSLWLALLVSAVAYCIWLYMRLQQRGAPYFS